MQAPECYAARNNTVTKRRNSYASRNVALPDVRTGTAAEAHGC